MVEKGLCSLQQSVGTDITPANDNFTKAQRASLKSLKHMDDIVIRQADKGGSVIILGMGQYVRENKKLLTDVTTYTKLQRDPTQSYKELLVTHINAGVVEVVLTQRQADYIIPICPAILVFHSFPKTHKASFPPSFRPIVSGINSLHENTKMGGLQPLIPNIPGYIRDKKHVLATLSTLQWQET